MKFTSMSKAALAAMLVAGTLAASPVLANADSSSDPVTVTTDQGNHQKVSVSVKNNDDGSKTVTVTMPKDQVIGHADSKGNTFTAKTDSDSDNKTNVDTGKVSVNGDNAKFKIELNQSAVENGDLMDTPLQIDITDNQGHHVGKISNVTLNQLIQQANKQKADANSSSKASSESSASSTSSSSASTSSQSSSSADSTADSNAATDDNDTQTSGVDTNNGGQNNGGTNDNGGNAAQDTNNNGGSGNGSNANSGSTSQQAQTFNSVQDLVNAMKKNGIGSVRGSKVIVTPTNVTIGNGGTQFDGGSNTRFTSDDKDDPNVVKSGQPVEVTINTVTDNTDQINQANSRDNGDYDYYISFSNPTTPQKDGQNGNQPGSTNNGGQGNAGSNGSIPQTGDQHSVLGVIAGGITSGLGMLGEFFSKKLF